MSSAPSEGGESWQKQFKKTVVAGGPLKGARYLDVSWDDLRKSARSYRGDPRFNQFAKRMMSERALGERQQKNADQNPSFNTWHRLKEFLIWVAVRSRGKMLLLFALTCFAVVLLTRPLFYVVIARSLALGVKITLRRSFGLLVILLDAILEEAAATLEENLLIAPSRAQTLPAHTPFTYEMQQTNSFQNLIMHSLFALLGAFFGHRWRAPVAVRNP